MKFAKSLLRSWLPLGVAFLLGTLFFGGSAIGHPGFPKFLHSGHSDTMNGTLTAKNFKYKKAVAARLVVSGSAFIPDTDASTFSHGNYSGSVQPTNDNAVVAPIDLPNGARITRVRWYYDTSIAGGVGSLHLEANDRTGGHADMSTLSSVACNTAPCAPAVDTTIAPNTINNGTTHYGLWLSDASATEDLITYKIVIDYKVGRPGPASSRPLAGATFSGRIKAHN